MAVVALCTVGYGDVVPASALVRLAGGMVVLAITFITIVTALVTSALVTNAQRRPREAEGALHPPAHETLARIEERLEPIDRRLAQR